MLRGLIPARNCSKAMALWSTPSAGRSWWPASSRLFLEAYLRLSLVRIIRIPLRLLAPLIVLLAVIGAYAIRNNMADVYIMLGLGIFVF